MSGIPYNELQPIEITAKDDSGETVVLETLYFSIVIPCRDCKHSDRSYWCKRWGMWGDLPSITPDGFCSWAERRA